MAPGDPVGARSGAGDLVLDLAAGTGVSTLELSRSGARVIGLDISLGMLRAGKKTRPDATLLAGDALALPFPDATFDAITISFGLRNIHDTTAALAEMARVTKPGGRVVICEFSHPTNGAFRHAYLAYLMAALPSRGAQDRVEPRRVRLPRRIDPGVAGPGRTGRRRWPRRAGQTSHGGT